MESFDERISLSSESLAILKKLEMPIHEPVLDETFLQSYLPNNSQYLSNEILEKLKPLSKGNDEKKPNSYINQVKENFIVDLAWNSSRLEGNSYTVLETERLFEFDQSGEDKASDETQMLLSHKNAVVYLIELGENLSISNEVILQLYSHLSKNLKKQKKEFNQILFKANQIKNPLEQAFFLMVQLAYMEPFQPLSRLAVNLPLFLHNLSPLSFIEVPRNLYLKALRSLHELNLIDLLRDVFLWGYERSSLFYSRNPSTLGQPDPFRIRYQILISEAVSTIVKQGLDKQKAVAAIKLRANHFLPTEDQEQFINSVELSLRSLHSGNFVSFEITLPEFEAWYKTWH